jgi:hypothetical protein
MSPDDLLGTRELRFKHGRYHVIVTAALDGTGSIKVLDDFYKNADPASAKEALRDAVKMLSIARQIAFEAFKDVGGTVDDLR